jgi:hypothetical protein
MLTLQAVIVGAPEALRERLEAVTGKMAKSHQRPVECQYPALPGVAVACQARRRFHMKAAPPSTIPVRERR